MNAHEEAQRKLAYIERELARKGREESSDHLLQVRADLLRRHPEAAKS